jgi:predicted aspartyl protease
MAALDQRTSTAATAGSGQGAAGSGRRALFGGTVVVLACLTLVGCSSTPSNTEASSQNLNGGISRTVCGRQTQPGSGISTVAVKVSSATGGKLVTVEVCVGGKGPYPFVVDTGSSRSIIDSTLASTLNLKPTKGGNGVPLSGSGCATTGNLVNVPALQMGDVAIAPQAMVTFSLSSWGGQKVDGVLGSDVFGRFGAMKLDLTKRAVTVTGTEGHAPVSNSIVPGNAKANLPADLLDGREPLHVVPIKVVQSKGTIAPYTGMTVATQGPFSFVVDTGAPLSTMDATAAYAAKIANHGTGPPPAGIGCFESASRLLPATLSIGSTSAKLTMLSIHIAGTGRVGVIGYLGLDYLGSSGAVVIDYASGAMAFLAG